ncbi:MAG: CxxC-x17-CxxC domain-containing protein [Chloroflexota bacterium]
MRAVGPGFAQLRQAQATIVCSSCGASAVMPFAARADRAVYCSKCYRRRQAAAGGRTTVSSGTNHPEGLANALEAYRRLAAMDPPAMRSLARPHWPKPEPRLWGGRSAWSRSPNGRARSFAVS